VEEMKKAGSHAGWFSDTATREEVDEIRVHSAPHKFLLESGCYKLKMPSYLKDGIDVQSVLEGLRGPPQEASTVNTYFIKVIV
jgi:hypothetical protein